ncbi:HTH domain-containing protein [Streptomyces sp. ISL-14]|nr:HTH domain-containing protein [Streptomyces sp. ISL-14]
MSHDESPTARALLLPELLQNNPGITADRMATRLGVSERAARRVGLPGGSCRRRGVWHAHLPRCRHSPTLRVDSLLRLAAARTRPRSARPRDTAPHSRPDPPDRPTSASCARPASRSSPPGARTAATASAGGCACRR